MFCSFNNHYKITPAMFDVWMRLLRPWTGVCCGCSKAARDHGCQSAPRGAAHAVAPERLVFAPRCALDEHLARHRLADLFLDTLPCNAHTTASDALWAGLPVLTCLGTTFAGRVAGSVLRAADVPELVAASMADYEALARRLATSPADLARVKARLAGARSSCALFDSERYTRHLEAAYAQMTRRSRAGLGAQAFTVT